MADFINFEVCFEDDKEDKKVSDNSDLDSDVDSITSFIDDGEQGNGIDFYHNFNNVETDFEQTIKNEYDEGLKDLQDFDEVSNLCQS